MSSIYDELWRRRRSRVTTSEQESEHPAPPPTRFHMNELSFERPTALKDKSLHMLTLNEEGPSPFTLVIARNRVQKEETLDTAATRLISEYEHAMHDPVLLEPLIECEIDNCPARRMMYKWHQHDHVLYQRHYLFITDDEHDQPVLIQLTATSNSPLGFTTEDNALLDRLIDSISLRQKGGIGDV